MKITRAQLIEAIRKNGYPWGKEEFVIYDTDDFEDRRVIEACVMGQAALNLMMHDEFVGDILEEISTDLPIPTDYKYRWLVVSDNNCLTLGQAIAIENDDHAVSYEDASNRAIALIEKYMPEDWKWESDY